ncbi:glycerate kinase [uncultured Jatrophihabitans sp.]|uniref:glycerate kinase family protein n=1 Tax=uncultured Jatrophihabitans sp. TaxID=1610747 RepID=UPI0035CA58EF
MPKLLAAPDKFRGTASAEQVAAAVLDAARDAGWQGEAVPVSDGGEGLLECFGGPNRSTRVSGPLDAPVAAAWRQDGPRAVLEMAQASGMHLVGDDNDVLAADTVGTGELIVAALDAGCRDIVVGVGGSASTDGGRGAVDVLLAHRARLGDAQLTVACDVRTTFVDAARVFGPQKGALAGDVETLTRRLEELADNYMAQWGVDVRTLPGAGAAGGLAGGLAALGARLRPGFEVVAHQVDLAPRVAGADLVVTGEGRLDATSLQGKVAGSLARLCRDTAPLLVLAGSVGDGAQLPGARVVDLSERFGARAARTDVLGCVTETVSEALRSG